MASQLQCKNTDFTTDAKYSMVTYYPEQEKHKCGYCKETEPSNVTNGMWAHWLTIEDYQDLIDRGWRRSGRYCYKAIMDKTCCPMYTIKCEALNFKLSKSQKKILKRVNKFLADGVPNPSFSEQPRVTSDGLNMECFSSCCNSRRFDESKINAETIAKLPKRVTMVPNSTNDVGQDVPDGPSCSKPTHESIPMMEISDLPSPKLKPSFKPGEGIDLNKPQCKKAKLLRVERKKQKLAATGLDVSANSVKEQQREGKTLEDFLAEEPKSGAHKLRISLVRTTPESEEWKRTAKQAYDVYVKYQMSVHGDSREKCSQTQFTTFLVKSPLQVARYPNGPKEGYGSFHQQYWLDDTLIAVGVLDILPKCVSSVYFFYDPDYGHLSLGTYGSLRELQFTRELQATSPQLEYYYMGYYIHSCPKMRYKALISPSFLLCPETYVWVPFEKCAGKLETAPYSRLNDLLDAVDTDTCSYADIKNISVFSNYTLMPYSEFRAKNEHDDREIYFYANLVGKKCALRMFLIVD